MTAAAGLAHALHTGLPRVQQICSTWLWCHNTVGSPQLCNWELQSKRKAMHQARAASITAAAGSRIPWIGIGRVYQTGPCCPPHLLCLSNDTVCTPSSDTVCTPTKVTETLCHNTTAAAWLRCSQSPSQRPSERPMCRAVVCVLQVPTSQAGWPAGNRRLSPGWLQ